MVIDATLCGCQIRTVRFSVGGHLVPVNARCSACESPAVHECEGKECSNAFCDSHGSFICSVCMRGPRPPRVASDAESVARAIGIGVFAALGSALKAAFR